MKDGKKKKNSMEKKQSRDGGQGGLMGREVREISLIKRHLTRDPREEMSKWREKQEKRSCRPGNA